jgi:chemotaxis protein MotB
MESMRNFFVPVLVAAVMMSCVPAKKYNSMRAEALRYEEALRQAESDAHKAEQATLQLTAERDKLAAELNQCKQEYSALDAKYQRLLADGSAEAGRMLKQLEENQRELDSRAAHLEELENLLKAREASILAIRRKVADALLGFEGKGLSISVKGDKVYVSMDDKLLFRSGSFEIGDNGAKAVRDLAGVLAANPDINIMVEGHTDDVPYNGSGNLKDNLDLSVKRATTVVRLLLENKSIAPERIIAAGRGEFLPVATGKSAEARSLNRRTEIILTPKLDELIKILDK